MPRTRGIALWEDLVIANLPDGRVIAHQPRQRRDRLGQEGRGAERVRQPGEVLHRAARRRRQGASSQNGAGDGGTRGWVAALDVKTGNELWRWYAVPKPGDPGSETWKDDHNAWKTGGGGIWQTGSYDPATQLYYRGAPATRIRIYDPQFAARATTSTPTRSSRSTSTPASSPGTSSTRRTTRGTTTRSASTCCTTRRSTARRARSSATSARNGFFYSLDRTNGRFIKAEPVRQRSELDQGHRSEDRQAGRVQPEARRADLQPGGARAARRRHEAHLPDVARRRRAPADSPTTRSRTSPTASAPKAASRRTAPQWRTSRPDGGIDDEGQRASARTPATSTTAR